MAITVKYSETAESPEPQIKRQKSTRGRPPGVVETAPRKPRTAQSARLRQFKENAKLPEVAAKIVEKVEETAGMTDDQLLERARTVPDARGGYNKGVQSITDEKAERIALAYRLMIRGLTVDQVAEQMDVSVATAKSYLEDVRKALRLDPKNLDVGYYMGESLSFYQEIRQMALLQASHGKNSVNEKINAMRVALEAEERKNQFLQKIGVYSPTVIERIERWMVAGTEKQIDESPTQSKRVNLAAEIGRLLAGQSRPLESGGPEPVGG